MSCKYRLYAPIPSVVPEVCEDPYVVRSPSQLAALADCGTVLEQGGGGGGGDASSRNLRTAFEDAATVLEQGGGFGPAALEDGQPRCGTVLGQGGGVLSKVAASLNTFTKAAFSILEKGGGGGGGGGGPGPILEPRGCAGGGGGRLGSSETERSGCAGGIIAEAANMAAAPNHN